MDKRAGWVIGRIAGAPVLLKPSALVMVAVLTVLFFPTVQAFTPGLASEALLGSFVVVVMLMLSVFLHELAHAVAARGFGFTVHELALTLWGGHTSYSNGRSTPLTSAVIAVVGPLANTVLAAAAWWIYQTQSFSSPLLLLLAFTTAYSNAVVAVFNLLPGLPLDGGQVTESLIWAVTGSRSTGTIAAAWTGRVLAIVMVAAAIAVPTLRGDDIQLFTVVTAALIGFFMWSSAGSALRKSRRRAKVEALDPRRIAVPAVSIDGDRSAAAIVDLLHRMHATHPESPTVVVLLAQGHPAGYVDPDALASVPLERLATTSAWSVAMRVPTVAVIDAALHGADFYTAVIAAAPFSSLCVLVAGSQVVGVAQVSDVARAVHLD